jgi:ComF family protein
MVPPKFVRAVAYGPYELHMRDAIHALKYDHVLTMAPQLGWMLAQAIATLAAEAPPEMLVIPVPLHRSKHAHRGFNQARSLAVHALESLHKSHPEWRLKLAASTLMRLRATSSQAGLTTRKRRLNVRGAFSVSTPADVALKHVLLIDDILTTGATARAAAQALMKAGAASVWVATLARAVQIHAMPASFADDELEDDSQGLPGQTPDSILMQGDLHFSSHDQSFFTGG